MKASKTKPNECVITKDISLTPPIRNSIKAIISHGNTSDLHLKNLKYDLKMKKRSQVYTFHETKKDIYNQFIVIPNGTFQSFSHTLKSSKNVYRVSLNYKINKNSASGAAEICEGIKGLRSLKDLTLNYWSPRQMDEEDLMRFIKGFKSLASLESLDFVMVHLETITKSGGKTLCSSLKSLSSLKRVRLGFHSKVMNTILPNLCKTLKTLVYLESLALKFSTFDKIIHRDLMPLAQTFHALPCLKSLNLDFAKGGLNDIEARDLSQVLRGLLKLKSFIISFEDCWRLTDNVMEIVCEILESLSSLQALSINLTGCHELAAKTAQSLVKSFESLISLESLSLNLSECFDFGVNGLQKLWEGIKSLKNLKKIDLAFCCWEATINPGLEGLDQTLKELCFLESLKMSFRACYIGIEGVRHLMPGLKSLISLKNLNLNFWGTYFNDVQLQELAQGLKSLPLVKNVDLCLEQCEGITIIGLKTIVEAVRNLACLKNAFLDFFGCGIKKEEVKLLGASLQKPVSGLPSVQIRLSEFENSVTHLLYL